ncbi:MAG: ParA family protein [Planctomycetes bacterium]|nr:ParA family protein [Planctomycetota bacterium]
MHSIVLANQKGGVGKTTTAIHLAHGCALAGQRVALLDLDPQGNATVALQGMSAPAAEPLFDLLQPVTDRLWLLPSVGNVATPTDASLDVDRLKALVEQLAAVVDLLVIDCPPRMDAWGWAGVQLSDEVVVPVQPEFFSMHGLSQMLSSLAAASTAFPGKARLRGVLPVMVDSREPVALEVLEDLRRNLGSKLLDSVIFRDPALVEAASHGKSVFVHSPWSKGALCYAELTWELMHGRSSIG